MVSCAVCVFGFRFLSTTMAVFRIFLSNEFTVFPAVLWLCEGSSSRAKSVRPRDPFYSILLFLLEEYMDDKSSPLSSFVTAAICNQTMKSSRSYQSGLFLKYHAPGINFHLFHLFISPIPS